jgi:o-succinylbenzoate synthase
MSVQFTYQPYQRQFRSVLQTHHGDWHYREGILLQLTHSSGQTGWGEIAPVPWFGSETLEQALCFCQHMPPLLCEDHIFTIPPELPACQFGFETAWETVKAPSQISDPDLQSLTYSGLLPTGRAALEAWPGLWNQGYRTFKWKIGVADPQNEQATLKQLCQELPSQAKLRLDANGGLDWHLATQWLTLCDRRLPTLEFLEQPLPIDQFEAMCRLCDRYQTLIALDESVATLKQLQACYDQGWMGIFVIKPAIVGSPRQLRQFCQRHTLDLVMSSVFETRVGRQAGLRLAVELTPCDRAVGYGIEHWFIDNA